MARKVTLGEAEEILGRCELREEAIDKDRAIDRGEPEDTRSFHWFNDQGDKLALGSFYGARDHFVEVLGSRFEDADADALIGCFRSRQVHVHGSKK